MRIHLFEFEDLQWLPSIIRNGGTDYLRYILQAADGYQPAVPLLLDALAETKQTKLIDLCSGGGGYIEQLHKHLSRDSKPEIAVVLTDKFPNYAAYEVLKTRSEGRIDFANFAVEAENVPADLKGFRVMFSAIHHFMPAQVKGILQDAIDKNAPIGIFDGYEKSIWAILSIIIVHPIALLLCTPFFKPFSFARLFFTYLIPLIPIYTVWDGCVSVLRMYSAKELLKIANTTISTNYEWKAGTLRNKYGLHSTYLIGFASSI